MVMPEEAALLRSEKLLAAGIRNAFDRETGSRRLRNARGGLPDDHDDSACSFIE